jgi:hypothetical protein
MKQVPQQSQYTILLESILNAPLAEGVLINLYNSAQLEGCRAGLTRAGKEYSKVNKFLGEPDELKGMYFSFTPEGKTVGLFRIKLAKKNKIEFEIVPSVTPQVTDLGSTVRQQ